MQTKNYNAHNAHLTLGMEILETNRYIRDLLSVSVKMESIRGIEATLYWMDGYLHHYQKYMKIRFYNPIDKVWENWETYDLAIEQIYEKLQNEGRNLDDFPRRLNYVFWLMKWSQLLSSCMHKLQLVPPNRMDGPNKESLMDEDPDETGEGGNVNATDSDGDNPAESSQFSFPVQN